MYGCKLQEDIKFWCSLFTREEFQLGQRREVGQLSIQFSNEDEGNCEEKNKVTQKYSDVTA